MSDEEESYEERWMRLMGYLDAAVQTAYVMNKSNQLPDWLYENMNDRVYEIESDLRLAKEVKEFEGRDDKS